MFFSLVFYAFHPDFAPFSFCASVCGLPLPLLLLLPSLCGIMFYPELWILFCCFLSKSYFVPPSHFPCPSTRLIYMLREKRLARSYGSALGAISGKLWLRLRLRLRLRLYAINENLFVSTSVWAGYMATGKGGGTGTGSYCTPLCAI